MDEWWKNFEKNLCVNVFVGVDGLSNEWDECDRQLICSSSVVGSDIPAIECGRDEQSIGEEFADDDEEFLCRWSLSQCKEGFISLTVLFGGVTNVVWRSS